ncbi:MAG: hypothetical protein AAF587_36135 [Bacteroidota bacterium]
MEQIVHIQETHNRLRVILNEEQTYVALLDDQGQALQISRGTPRREYLFSQSPGTYVIATDGEILETISEIHEAEEVPIEVRILGYQLGEAGGVIASINGGLFQGSMEELAEKAALDKIKSGLLVYIGEQATQQREQLLPTQELLYGVLGVREKETLQAYRATVMKFEEVLGKLHKQIKKARSAVTLASLKLDFPSRIVSVRSKPSPRKKSPIEKRPLTKDADDSQTKEEE